MAYQVDTEIDAIEYAYDRGWSDGLPVVPPTRDRIDRMLDGYGYKPDMEIGQVPERKRSITAELVAANAVMAGCTDAMFPVVLAAVEAVLDPGYNIVGPSASTGGAAALVIVHGPVVNGLGFNSETAVLGAGNRSNLTLGRAFEPGHPQRYRQRAGRPGQGNGCPRRPHCVLPAGIALRRLADPGG